MATAPASDQLVLLEVAELDRRIARLERDNTKHPLREELGTLMNAAAARARDLDAVKETLLARQREMDEAEAASQVLKSQIEAKEAKLNSGEGLTSRDLLVLQEEIEGLKLKHEDAVDGEFVALEAVEAAEDSAEKIAANIAAMKDTMLERRARLEDEVTEILAEQSALKAEREKLFSPLDEDLKRIYERARSRGGYSVMELLPNGTTDAGIALSPVEVAQIKALPEEEIYLSEDYDCIIVRRF